VGGNLYAHQLLMLGAIEPTHEALEHSLQTPIVQNALQRSVDWQRPFWLDLRAQVSVLNAVDPWKGIRRMLEIGRDGADHPRRRVVHNVHEFTALLTNTIMEDIQTMIENEYEIAPDALHEIRLEFAPGEDLMAAWQRVDGAGFVPTPDSLAVKKATINITPWKNPKTGMYLPRDVSDPRCFQYCVLAYFRHQEIKQLADKKEQRKLMMHMGCMSKYRACANTRCEGLLPLKSRGINFSAFNFETQPFASSEQIDLFELDNRDYEGGISIIIYKWHQGCAHLYRVSRVQGAHEIILVYFSPNKTLGPDLKPGHFVLVTSFPALMFRRHNHMKYGTNTQWCHRCGKSFPNKKTQQRHIDKRLCLQSTRRLETMRLLPQTRKDGKPVYAEFSSIKHRVKHPWRLYTDLETRKVCINEADDESSHVYENVPVSGAYVAKCDPEYLLELPNAPPSHEMFHGPKSAMYLLQSFVKHLMFFVKLEDKKDFVPPSPETWADHCSRGCYACKSMKGPFKKDHCHIAGVYRGPLCEKCNPKMRRPQDILVLAHNGGSFDFMLLLKALCMWKQEPNCPPEVWNMDWEILPKSTGKLTSMTLKTRMKGEIRGERWKVFSIHFLDSLNFYPQSLEAIVDVQKKVHKDPTVCFPTMAKYHPWREQLSLLTQKMKFPYAALGFELDDWSIPVSDLGPNFFNSDMKQTECTMEEWGQYQTLFRNLGLRTFRQLHDCYLWSDVFQLCDCMENFRDQWFEHQKLDLYQSRAIAAASYRAMMYEIGPVFELVTKDHGGWELHNLIANNLIGGVSHAAMTHVDLSKTPDWILMAFDACSMYPTCLQEPIPVGGFRKVHLTFEQTMALIRDYDDTYRDDNGGRKAYIIHCSFECDPERHDEIDLPPPCRMIVTKDDVSPEQLANHGGKISDCPKIVPYLGLQSGARHIALLQLWTHYCHIKIHQVFAVWECYERPVLREYVQRLAEQRANAPNKLLEAVIKLQMVSFIGYFGLNADKHCSVRLTTNQEVFYTKVARGRNRVGGGVENFEVLDFGEETFMGLTYETRQRYVYDTPRYISHAVYDRSKFIAWRFRYGFTMHTGLTSRFAYMDTDSLFLLIKCKREDIPIIMRRWNENPECLKIALFDMTGHLGKDADGNFIKCPNKGKLSSWKDDFEGLIPLGGIWLAPKQYSIKLQDGEDIVFKYRSKGLPMWVLKKWGYQAYEAALLNGFQRLTHTIPQILAVKFTSMQRTLRRKGVHHGNDKCLIWSTGGEFEHLPHGHKRCRDVINDLKESAKRRRLESDESTATSTTVPDDDDDDADGEDM
jgi:hypothetical protein